MDENEVVTELQAGDVKMLDFITTREVTLTDDDIERMKRADEFDLVILERRGIKLAQDHRQ